MKQQEVMSKMLYHRKRYEYYKWLLLDWSYSTKTDIRYNEEEVLQRIANKYQIHIDEIKSQFRYRPLPQARSEAIKIFKDEFWLTFSRIADIIGQKNHTGIMYLYKRKYDNNKNSKEVS